jgi:hypothetical protein
MNQIIHIKMENIPLWPLGSCLLAGLGQPEYRAQSKLKLTHEE